MSTSIFSLSTIAARRFEPSTVAEANAISVLRVVRWFAVALAVALAVTAAAGWFSGKLAIAAYDGFGYFSDAETVTVEPGLSLAELAEASESLVIEWPVLKATTVAQQVQGELPLSTVPGAPQFAIALAASLP